MIPCETDHKTCPFTAILGDLITPACIDRDGKCVPLTPEQQQTCCASTAKLVASKKLPIRSTFASLQPATSG